MFSFTRREFASSAMALCTLAPCWANDSKKRMRIGVIGHTGRGDYGHGLSTMWLGIPESEVVAVADPDPKGLAANVKALGNIQGFADYRKMLTESKPDVVAIGMRHIDQHRDVAIAAMESNVQGIYMEKPFCRSPSEADEILAAASTHHTKIAVAHRNRYHPALPVVKRLIEEGAIGRLLEYRMRGKEDARGGVLDLWVLGSHLMNLVQYFAGRPMACTASVFIDGRPALRSDAVPGAEGIGLMVGNEVHARFEMENGLTAYFDSIAKAGTAAAGFGLQFIGTEGMIDLRIDREPLAHIHHGSPFLPVAEAIKWIPISSGGIGVAEPNKNLAQDVSKHWLAGRDLLQAIENDRLPLCSAADAASTIEMITAVPASHLQNGARVVLPLLSRNNPWSE